MQKMMRSFVTLLISASLAGCAWGQDVTEFVGVWMADDVRDQGREISMRQDGKFMAAKIPAAMVFSSAGERGDLDGSGTWEYQPDDDRIFLVFTGISSEKCSVPYGVMVFIGPGKKLSLISDVDKPSTGIEFSRM